MLVRNPPGEVPWPDSELEWDLFADGVLGLLAGLAGFIAVAWLIARYLPKIPFLRGLILSPTIATSSGGTGASMTRPAAGQSKRVAVGDKGEAVSALRPAGKARFGEAIVDVVAKAEYVEKGRAVEIIEIHGNRVVVRGAASQE
jgi:membrane-bound serine protease (ClpP class)